jgi:hypothetical protein
MLVSESATQLLCSQKAMLINTPCCYCCWCFSAAAAAAAAAAASFVLRQCTLALLTRLGT